MKKNFEQFLKDRVIEHEVNAKLQKEIEEESRGNTVLSNDRQNFCILYGCPPATGVKSDTTMVYDLSRIFLEKIDRPTMSLIIPQAFEEITGRDVSFEVAQSNQLAPVRLVYEHNIVH